MQKKVKALEIISRIFFVLFCLIIIYDFIARVEQKFYCFGHQIDLYILLSFLIISIIFKITALLIQRKHQLQIKNSIKSFLKFLLISLILTFALLIILWPSGGKEKARDAKRIADIKSIQMAQEMFYENELRYAISQKELFEKGYLSNVLVDPVTKKEYTDNDGFGIEGGDENPKTWIVQTVLKKYNEICSKEKPVEVFLCNEKGCGEKIINSRI